VKITLLFLILSFAIQAQASSGITVHGKIVDSSNNPLVSAAAEFRIRIKSPTGNCLLWEETQIKDMSASNGVFTITVGDSSLVPPARIQTSVPNSVTSAPFQLPEVFANGPSYTGLDCGTYNSVSLHGRLMEMAFRPTAGGGSWEEIPSTPINYVPLAYKSVDSETLGSRSANEFLKIASYPSQTILSNVQVDTLLGLVNGTATTYLRPSDNFLGDVTGPSTATVVSRIRGVNVVATAPTVNQVLKYDGSNWVPSTDATGSAVGDASYAAKGVVQGLTDEATSGLRLAAGVISLGDVGTAGTYGSATQIPVITTDTKGRVTGVVNTAVNDSSKLPLAGGTMTGAINMGNQNITNINSVAATNFSGRNLVLNDNDTNTITIRTPTDIIANYALTLPVNDGAPGEVLTTDGAGVLSWSAGGGAGDITEVAAGTGLTGGATTGVATLAVDVGLGIGRIPQVGGAALGAGDVIVADATGTALTSLNCGLNQVIKFDGAGIAGCGTDETGAGSGFVNNGNTFPGAATLGTNDNFSLTFETDNQPRMTIDNTGNVGIGTTSPNAKLQLSTNPFSETGDFTNFRNDAFYNAGTNNTGTLTNIFNDIATDGSGNKNNIIGVYNQISHGSTGNLAEAVGTDNYVRGINGNGAITNAIGTRNVISNMNTASTIDTAIGTYTNVVNTSTGSITNAYGLFIEDLAGTNSWGVYQVGASDRNYFAGNVGIGVMNPNTALDINGVITQRGLGVQAVSPAGQGRIYFSTADGKFKISENGGAYVDLVGGGSGATNIDGLSDAEVDTVLNNFFLGAGTGALATNGNNTGVGIQSLLDLTNGTGNTAFGRVSLQNLSVGDYNTSIGAYSTASLTTGSFNTALGDGALLSATSTSQNTAVGRSALVLTTTGSSNTAIGMNAGATATGASSSNIFLGVQSGPSSNTVLSNTLWINNGPGSPLIYGNFAADRVSINSPDATALSTFDVNGDVNIRGIAAAPSLSAVDSGKIYFDSTSNKFRVSENGGAFVDLVGAGGSSGTFLADDGSASSPSISFTNDPDTGFYRIDPDGFLISLGGSDAAQFTNGTFDYYRPQRVFAGSAASPAYELSANSSSSTGLFSPAINVIGFSNNGSESMRIGATGNVGIGTTAPNAKLDVQLTSNLGNGDVIASFGTSAGERVEIRDEMPLDFRPAEVVNTNSTLGLNIGARNGPLLLSSGGNGNGQSQERMRIMSSGVGIGVIDPNTALDVLGATTIRGLASAPADAPVDQGRIYFDSTSNKFRVSENGGAYVDLVGSGGVSGTGTTNSIPKWSSATGLANSILEEDGTDILIDGMRVGHGPNGDGTTTVVGEGALFNVTTGYANTAIGANALQGVNSQWENVAVGVNAGFSLTSNVNTAIGTLALEFGSGGGGGNTAIGSRALRVVGGHTGNNNTVIGRDAATNLTSGSENIIIGYNVDAPTATGNSQLNIGNLIYGDMTTGLTKALDIDGAFNLRGRAAPAVSPAGQGRIYFSTAENKFKISENGGAYVDLVGAGGSSGDILQGGNSFGAGGMTIGTNDNFGLNFETNSTTRMTITNDGSLLINGDTGVTPASGAGTRLMWIPEKSAIRAGIVSGTEWDDINIGERSVAFGNDVLANGFASTISGGAANEASATYSTIGGGIYNIANFEYATVGGGSGNSAINYSAVVSGGLGNSASGNRASVIGGIDNIASGLESTVVGGASNTAAGDHSLAGGANMQLSATADRSFAWGYSAAPVAITQADAFIIYSSNLGIGNVNPSSKLDLSGAATMRGMAAPSVSPAGQGRIYFSTAENKFKVSQNGGAYVDLVGAGGGSGDVLLGGNTTAAAMTIGTNSNFGLNLEVNGDTKIAIGTDGQVAFGNSVTPPNRLLSSFVVDRNPFDVSTGQYANIRNSALFNGVSNTGTLSIILNEAFLNNNSTWNNVYASENRVGLYAGSVANGVGSLNEVVSDFSATSATLLSGTRSRVTNAAGATTTANAYHADVVVTGGTLTDARGLYIDDLQGTNRWGIYQNGASDSNFFAGNIGIGAGVTAPSSALDLNGSSTYRGIAAPAVSPAGQGRIYFSTAEGKFKVSQNGGAYTDLVGGGATSLDDLTDAVASSSNIFLGPNVGALATGVENTAIGFLSMQNLTTGIRNVAIGHESLNQTTTGSTNTAMGMYVMAQNVDGNDNTAIGDAAMSSSISGSENTAIGRGALSNITTGNNNAALGHGAGRNATAGSYGNVFIGYESGPAAGTTLNNSLWINNGSGTPLIYGDFSTGRVGIGTTSPNTILDINGAITQRGMAAPTVSPAGQGRIYFSTAEGKFKVSQNGGAFVDLVGGGGATELPAAGGSAGAPGYAFSGDTNTGLFSSGVGTLGLSTAGTERMQIDSTGRVGVGRAPASNTRLAVQGAVVASTNIIPTGATVDLSLGNMQLLKAPGSPTIALTNLASGGTYTLYISDLTSRTYDFTGCTNRYFNPANGPTTFRSTYTISVIDDGGSIECYINWSTGFN